MAQNSTKSAAPKLMVAAQAFTPAGLPGNKPSPVTAHKPSPSFDAWWLLAQNKNKLNPQMKEAVKQHLTSAGFMKSGKYDDGLKHFGVKAKS